MGGKSQPPPSQSKLKKFYNLADFYVDNEFKFRLILNTNLQIFPLLILDLLKIHGSRECSSSVPKEVSKVRSQMVMEMF